MKLKIEFSGHEDGTLILRCTRADGSVTWQKRVKHGAHFILHDITHYSVETVLQASQGFFGLIALGWDIDDTTGKGSRGALPPEALEVERIVGLLDTERASGVITSVEDFNTFAPRPITQDQIDRIRSLRGSLSQQWLQTRKLSLDFSTA
jgi:hypothetical protein